MGAYDKALKNAPQWVRDAYEEYQNLPEEKKANKPFLYFLLGGKGTPAFKQPKKEADYTDESEVEGQTCGNCIFYYVQPQRDISICSKVRGKVKEQGWCKYWQSTTGNE